MRRYVSARYLQISEKIGVPYLAANLQSASQQSADAPHSRSRNMLTILLSVLVIALLGGGLGHSRYGYAGWSPAGILVVILLLWLFTGHRV